MTERKRMICLLTKICPLPFVEIGKIADYLLENGVVIRPHIPGPTEDNPNIMELCFHNGERNMKEKIIAKLMEHKTCVDGICHTQIAWLFKLLEDM